MQFQFIHCADLHLDSPLRGLCAYEDAPLEEVRSASRVAFQSLIDEAIRLPVAFLVVSGDIVDGHHNDTGAGVFFIRQCSRALAAGIGVYAIFGNHDAESNLGKRLTWPNGIHLFDYKKAHQMVIEEIKVAITGQSYGKRDVTENLAAKYPPGKPGYFNIGLLHTCLTGDDTRHDPYAPCSMADLASKEIDYWALGHVHTASVVSKSPWVVFPGNLQGRSVRETGPRGAVVVTVDDGRVQGVEWLRVERVRFNETELDVSGIETLSELGTLARPMFDEIALSAEGRTVGVRLRLTGRTRLHSQLQNQHSEVRVQLLSVAAGISSATLWIEEIDVRTRPERTPEQIAARGDALADLQKLLMDAGSDSELMATLQREVGDVLAQLPTDPGSPEPSNIAHLRTGDWASLVRDLVPDLVEDLASEG